MSLKRRLERLEQESASQTEKKSLLDSPERVREEAERRLGEGREPVFQITEEGGVHTRDGQPVTDYRQTLAEEFYQWELGWYEVDSSSLIFDADSEAFYTPEGELALSRTYVDLSRLIGGGA